jgi:hypothetical protein
MAERRYSVLGQPHPGFVEGTDLDKTKALRVALRMLEQ